MNKIESFFSPNSLSGPYINSCDLFVDRKGPESDEMRCDVQIHTPDERQFEHTNDGHFLYHDMTVEVRLIEELGDEEKEMMHASISMAGTVSLPNDVNATTEDIESNLFMNAVSLFYSSARSYIELLTGQSSMRRFTIPAINPEAYAKMQIAE